MTTIPTLFLSLILAATTPQYRTWLPGPIPSDAILRAQGYPPGVWIIMRLDTGQYQIQQPIACSQAALALVSTPQTADCFVLDEPTVWNGAGAHERRLQK